MTLARNILSPFLTAERTVDVWFSLLPRIISLAPMEGTALNTSIDMIIISKSEFQTHEKPSRSFTNLDVDLGHISFTAEKLVLLDLLMSTPIDDLDTLIFLLYSRLYSLNQATKHPTPTILAKTCASLIRI